MEGMRLPGAPEDEGTRIVAHVDMDCFYAACERLREPALVGEPVVVGMGYEPDETHGAVATASYEAREYGVESAMPISEALELLPRKVDAAADPDLDVTEAGFYRPVDMDYYESVSEEVRALLESRSDVLREVSIDEAYLDVTGRTTWDGVAAWARDLKSAVEDRVGIVASVGVAPTMSAAKVASDRDKPDGRVVVQPGCVREFFADLPVEAVHGVGPVTAAEFAELGIETAGDVAAADPETLEDRFGERGREIYRFARGEDDREVTPRGRPKSLSRESALPDTTTDAADLRDRVRSLAESVAERARARDALYRTIGIKVVTPPYDVNTRAHTLPGPVDDPSLVASVATELLAEFADDRVRKVSVRVSNLSFDQADQASLDGWEGRPEDEDDGGRTPGEDGESTPGDEGDPVSDEDGRPATGEEDGRSGAGAANDREDPRDRTARRRAGQTRIQDF